MIYSMLIIDPELVIVWNLNLISNRQYCVFQLLNKFLKLIL